MPDHPNAVLARKIDEAFSRGDMQALDGYIADDVIWHEIGRAEPRRGKAALRESSGAAMGDYQITARMHDVVANDDHTVVLVEATATRGGKTFTYRTAEIYHVKDGKIAERWAFSDDTAAIAAFFK
jgi:ketosteroid isomerase-like protein